jgi:hypothetical protein
MSAFLLTHGHTPVIYQTPGSDETVLKQDAEQPA